MCHVSICAILHAPEFASRNVHHLTRAASFKRLLDRVALRANDVVVVLAAGAAATKSLKAVLDAFRGLTPSLPTSSTELLIRQCYGALLTPDCLCVRSQFDLGFRERVVSMALMWRSALSRMADPVGGPLARANADGTALRTYGAIDERLFRTVHLGKRVTLLPPIPVRRANLSKGFSPTHGLPGVLKHQRGICAFTRGTL